MLRKIWPANKYSVYIYIYIYMLLFEPFRFLNCCFGNISLINMSHWRVLSIWNFLCGKRCHAVWHLLHLSGCCMKMKTNDPGTHTHTHVLGMIQSLPSVWWVLYPDECWLWKNKLQSLSCNQKTSVKIKIKTCSWCFSWRDSYLQNADWLSVCFCFYSRCGGKLSC